MRGLSIECLESRAMLAQTPQVLFQFNFDPTNAQSDALSETFQLQDKFVAVLSINDSGFSIVTTDANGDGQNFSARELFGKEIGRPDDVVQFGEKLFLFFDASSAFVGNTPGQQVWSFDLEQGLKRVSILSEFGTSANTVSGKQNPFLFSYADHLYFTADATVSRDGNFEHVPGDFGLWKTDGSEAGTLPAMELIPGLESVSWSTEVDGKLLLSAKTNEGHGVWTFDGTAAGTQLLYSSNAGSPIKVGERAFFVADSEAGRELHVSDGTVEGTSVAVDLNPGPAGSEPTNLLAFEDGMVFTADAGDGEKLWFSDGTFTGTTLLFDGTVGELAVADQLYFTTGDGPYELQAGQASQVSSIFSSESVIDLSGTTDKMLLFESGGDHYTVGANLDSAQPMPFVPPGALQLTTSEYFVFTSQTVEAVVTPIDEFGGFPETIFTIQPWISDGTQPGTKEFGDPSIDRAGPSVNTPGEQYRVRGVQQLDGYLALHTLSWRFESDSFIRNSTFAYEFDDLAEQLPGDANRDGTVDFDDFLKLSGNFGKVDAAWADGDFDGDGEVDFSDFLLLSRNFGSP